MMKKTHILITLIFLLFISPAFAQDGFWFYRSSYLILEPEISTSFDVVSRPNQKIEYVIANISFFPRQTRTQRILESQISPAPEPGNDVLTFTWKRPAPGNMGISIKNRIKTINSPARIRKKLDFPIDEKDIPKELTIYTEPAEIIDINSRIINLASEIATGEDDLFIVVDKIANWVNKRITYNLSTVTVEAAQKSSWVLENREGVCDELTSLFISMLRSLGIPARFVSGISYTNLEIFENKWGAHGWAEVYFPGYGWVPFDVTYGEYGWVDPTHIVSKIAEDAGKFTSQYVWRAERGVSLKIGSLNTNVSILEKGQPRKSPISLRVNMLKENTGFGSYNLATVQVRNLADYYQSLDIFLSQTSRLKYIEPHKKHIVLRPNEEKNVYWIIRTDESLDRDYMYTFPVVAYTLDNVTAKDSFIAVDNAKAYSLNEINRTVMQSKVEDTLTYSRKVRLNCTSAKEEYYDYEKPLVLCSLKNTGNVFLKNTKICLKDDCLSKNIGITEEKSINFTARDAELGENEVKVTARNGDISKVAYADFLMLDTPKIDIGDVEYPFEADYKEDYVFRFKLNKKSASNPRNIMISVKVNRKLTHFEIESLGDDRDMEVRFRGRDLRQGKNDITVTVNYKDKNEEEYGLERTYSLELKDVTSFQKVMIFVRTIF